MKVRMYSEADLRKCMELFVKVFNGEPWHDQWSVEDAERYLNDYANTPGFQGVVAENESGIIGFVFGVRKKWWSGDEFLIQEMCVDNEMQKSGIGTEILSHLERILRKEEVSRMTLLTNKGIPAEKFYKKMGFVEIDRLIFMNKDITS